MTADWNTEAACREADPEVFDTCCAAKTVPPDAAEWCDACPVRQQCYDLAMRTEAGTSATYRFGIFGGTSPWQRTKNWPKWATAHGISGDAQRAGLAPCGTAAAYRRHLRKGEPIDEACAAGNRRDHAERAARQRGPIECGTRRGYQQHRRNGEQACQPCKDANNAADRRLHDTGSTLDTMPIPAKPRGGGIKRPIDHGTYRGARQHERRQEDLCPACRAAYNMHHQEMQARRRRAKKAAAA